MKLYTNTAANGVRKVHYKLLVIDERLTIVGSYNYTAPAATLNDENIIVLGDLEETTAAPEIAQRTLAGYTLTAITRIINNLSEPVLALGRHGSRPRSLWVDHAQHWRPLGPNCCGPEPVTVPIIHCRHHGTV